MVVVASSAVDPVGRKLATHRHWPTQGRLKRRLVQGQARASRHRLSATTNMTVFLFYMRMRMQHIRRQRSRESLSPQFLFETLRSARN